MKKKLKKKKKKKIQKKKKKKKKQNVLDRPYGLKKIEINPGGKEIFSELVYHVGLVTV